MIILQILFYGFLILFGAAICVRMYPIIVHRMTAEEYYEGRDFFPLEDEMSDERLFRRQTPIEIIERVETEC